MSTGGAAADAEPVIDLLDQTWGSILDLGTALGAADFDLPTDCPGWSVKDHLSHVIGIERMLLGHPADPPVADPGPHVTNDVAAFNEAAVAARRDRPGPDVLEELRAITAERLSALRSLEPDRWEEVGPTPTGQGTYRHFMTMRAFDSWVHEQDIRRAVDRPGHLYGPVVAAVMAWHRRNLGYVVGKRARAPEGAVVAFDVTGPEGRHIVVAVRDGRAHVVEDPTEARTDAPDATLRMDVETFNALCCGRWSARDARSRGRLGLDGDPGLAGQVAESMAYVQ